MAESDDDYSNAMSEDEAGAPETNGSGGGPSRSRNGDAGNGRLNNGVPKERWEAVDRSWDQVTEGADGSLAGAVEGLLEAGKRKRLLKDTTPLQRGIIRHVTLIIDLSIAMAEKDYRPTRALLALRTASDFVRNFFEQNPISQLALITTHSGLAHIVTSMSGNPAAHTTALATLIANLSVKQPPAGSPSLQNSLDLARASLAAAPSHGTKEVILLYGALQTADPGDIHATIRSLVDDRVRVSIVGLAARMAILTELVVRTNGLPSSSSTAASSDALYGVALHEAHFRTLLMGHTTPPATSAAEQARRAPSLLPMGFPSRVEESGEGPSLCACHHRPSRGGYLCTRCSAKVCGLPIGCPTCGLQLVQSTHLARSYHHLFPLKNYREVGWDEVRERRRLRRAKWRRSSEAAGMDVDGEGGKQGEEQGEEEDPCFGCLSPFPALPKTDHSHDHGKANGTHPSDKRRPSSSVTKNQRSDKIKSSAGASESSRYACTSCERWFCIECDIFAHEVVHNCAGCLCGGGDGDGEGEGEQV